MKVFLIPKKKGRIYRTESIAVELLGQTISHDEKGAPLAEGLFVSVSDTKSYWAMAVSSEGPVGLDLEEAGRAVKASSAKRLHKKEQEYLKPLQPESSEWREEFLLIWTRKEAYMKLRAEGLRMGLSSFSVIDDSKTHSFKRKDLIIGIAADYLNREFSFEIEEPDYDAPFEKSCLEAAADMLNMRMYSAKEMEDKLKAKGYPDEEIDKAIKKLAEYNYINDADYARLKAEKLAASGMAPRRIELELKRKGLGAEIASEASESYKEDERTAAAEIAAKIAEKTTLPEGEERYAAVQKLKAKIARKLSSLGYESSIIYDILDRLKL